MLLFDSHSHPHFNAFKDDADEVIERALRQGVEMLLVGTQIDTSKKSIEVAERHEGVWAAVGLHPIHLEEGYFDPEEDPAPDAVLAATVRGQSQTGLEPFKRRAEAYSKEVYRGLAMSSKKVVAIGECGLDYYRLEGDEMRREAVKAKQQQVFREQAELAAELDLALVVHCRNSSPAERGEREKLSTALSNGGGDVSPSKDAQGDVFKILQSVKAEHPNLRVVIHCFTGIPEEAKRHLGLGFYISFSGIITFAHDWDEFIRATPLGKLLIETDCPYLTPVPHRGKRNEPAYVEYTAQHLAKLKGVSFEEVARVTTANAKRLFNIANGS